MPTKRANPTGVRQGGEIYDIFDLQLALMDLKKLGFDLHVSTIDARALQITCNKTQTRFSVECVGHNAWPELDRGE